MIVVACPECREQVTVPEGLRPPTRVSCPWCRAEYSLSEALAGLPPKLIVVENGDPEPTDEMGPAIEIAPSSEFESLARSAPDAWQPPTTISLEGAEAEAGAPRRRRARSNPAAELAKVIGGGLLAFPLAQLILWWLPGSMQRDPLDLGPKIAKVAPWIVPENLHTDGAGERAEGAEDTSRPRVAPLTPAPGAPAPANTRMTPTRPLNRLQDAASGLDGTSPAGENGALDDELRSAEPNFLTDEPPADRGLAPVPGGSGAEADEPRTEPESDRSDGEASARPDGRPSTPGESTRVTPPQPGEPPAPGEDVE